MSDTPRYPSYMLTADEQQRGQVKGTLITISTWISREGIHGGEDLVGFLRRMAQDVEDTRGRP